MNWFKRIWYKFFSQSFKVGDKVYCKYYDEGGVVTAIQSCDTYPLKVVLPARGRVSYTKDGKLWVLDKSPSLIHVSEGE